jgi:polyisoprenoid-binding protein YceI
VWAIDAGHSVAEFGVKHMMVSTTKGRFTEVSGTIAVDDADITKSSVDVTINVASVNTFDEKRDAHLKSPDFFDAETYPTITFKSTKIEPKGDDEYKVTGDLTIRGVTRPVVLDAEANGRSATPWGTEVIAFSAETSISRKDFGLNWNVALEAGGVLVGDKVKIAIETEAIKQR